MDDCGAWTGAAERAAALEGLIGDEAEAGERLGRLTDPVADALMGARLLSILIPREAGGLGGGRADFFEAVETIARGDGSAGWCVSVVNAINHTAFRGLPREGREEVFGEDPVACWAILTPNATATPVSGGFRVSCRGTFGSGSSLSRWVLIAANEGAAGEGRYRAFLVPKAEVEIREGSWDVMGLRATASLDYEVTDVLVPDRRSWAYTWLPAKNSAALSTTESARLNAIGLSAFASGVGQRARSELIGSARKTRRVVADGFQADDEAVQQGLGEVDGRLRAARNHLLGLARILDQAEAEGRAVGGETAIETVQAGHTLARAARDMTIFAFDNAGASAIRSREPLQRCLRDIFTGLKHAAFTPSMLARVGRVRLGLPFGGSPV